jgi:hypothetical protein
MNKLTNQLKEQISKLDSIEERLEILKDKYAGKTAVILCTGPSLNDYDHKEMRDMFSKRDDLVIMPMKQAYNVSQETSDFHIQNLWSMDRKVPTKYKNIENTISFFNVAKSFTEEHLEMIVNNNHPCDLWAPCLNPPYVTDKDTIQATGNYDLFWMLSKETQTMWGKTLLYSSAIPIALHIGCRSIVTMGWDLGTGVHFYPDNSSWSAIANKPDVKYTNEAVETTPQLYEWCKNNNINFRILSNVNPADDRIERLKSIQDI